MDPTSAAPILLVDDEPANLLALEAVLQDLGEPMVRAGSGHQALRQLRDQDFAAVLLDVHMPEMDGFETAKLIRAQRRSRETPILFITADASDLSSSEAYALGAVDLLAKPLKSQVLKGKLGFFIELHRRKQELQAAERRAVQDRAFLTAVLEAVEDGIVACDAEGQLTLVNRATRNFLGVAEEPIDPCRWPPPGMLLHLDGSPMRREELPLMRALAGDQVSEADLLVKVDGHPARCVVASGQALYDDQGRKLGAVVSLHDVTAWRDAQAARERAASEQIRREEAEATARLLRESREQVRASAQRYRALFESIDEGFFIIEVVHDRERRPIDYVFLETNPAFAKQTGLHDVTGKRVTELRPDIEPFWIEIYGRVAATGQPVRFEQYSEAMARWYDVYASRLGDEGSDKVAVLFSDITDRKRAEDDLRRLASELAESDRRKTEFLATLAHELRNPLAPISNGLHLLRMSPANAAAQDKARAMMERQLRHMVHLVDDLLDIARISRDKVELRRARVELASVLTSAVETSMPVINASGHELDVQITQEPLVVDGDATRIAQVVSNLLNNAAKYTPHGGRIELRLARDGDEALIRVRDTGLGIAPGELPKVFEMFTQVGRNREHAQGGLGIGLALVRRLVMLHGGTVEAHSEGLGKGSTFTVRLPLDPAASSAPREPLALTDQDASEAFRILVVDDNIDAADSLAALLEMEGHRTRVAHDGDEALLAAQDFDPHIVFLDIGMPGKDGYHVARLLRANRDCDCVLVALTGWGAQEDRQRSRDAGFDHHLTKPAELHAVEALLHEVARQRRHIAAAADGAVPREGEQVAGAR